MERPSDAVARLQRAWEARGALSNALLPLAALYGALSALRRALYRSGWLRSQRLGVPVVVVGNLLVGGAGKTPTVLAVVELLRRHGFVPGIVSRGYGRRGADLVAVQPDTPVGTCGDEPLLLQRRSGAPVMVGRDRVRAGRALLRLHPQVNVIVSDDGLQHLRLARNVQVLVFDARGAGNGRLLPAGPLREPMPRALPPKSIILYNADAASTALPGTLARRSLSGAVALEAWWRGAPASQQTLAALRARPLVAAAGLARPERFFAMLRACGLRIAELALPDHCDYATLPWPGSTADVIVTEKDAVKIDPARTGRTRVWVAALDFATSPEFDAQLMELLALPASGKNHGNPTA